MAITFTALTGASNPFNGVDVGTYSKPFLYDFDSDGDIDAFIGEYDGTINYYRNDGTRISPTFNVVAGGGNPLNGRDAGVISAITFVDIDNDGDQDAFSGEFGGTVKFYRNTGTAIAPSFSTEVTDGSSPFHGVDFGTLSQPTFGDIDGDGDQDAFIAINNGTILFYRNASGTFSSVTGGSNPLNGVNVTSNAHVYLADVDRDGDLDAFVGNSTDGSLYYYKNTGTAIAASFVQQTGSNNPFNGQNFSSNASAAFADVDSDGDLDAFIGNYGGAIAYYRNDSTAPVAPAYIERTGASNPFNGVDVGYASAPGFADLNRDGDVDVFIGGLITRTFYANTGSAVAPAFSVQTGASDPFDGLFGGGDIHIRPTFSDIDGDGDLDAFITQGSTTSVRYFKNTGNSVSASFAEQTGGSNPLDTLTLGLYRAAIAFVDIDADGDQDAFLGSANGVVAYFRNTGTATNPVFAIQAGGSNPLNGVDVGYDAQPVFADIDRDGDQDALISEQNGGILYYENTGTAANAQFLNRTGASNPFNSVNLPSSPVVGFWDVDGDGDLDAFIGEAYGAIKYYENTATAVPANAAPTLTGLIASVTYNENTVNATAQVVDSDVTFADADSADLNGGNLTITYSSGGGAEDQLAIRNEGTGAGQIGISAGTVTYGGVTIGTVPTSGAGSGINGATLVVTFTAAAATPTAVDALIQNITYLNNSNSPTAARTISITVNDGDGGTSTAATTVINVTAQNDAPVVAAFDATPSFTEGGSATVLDNNLTLSDADSTNLTGATISISANFVSGDRLNFTDQNGITGSYNSGTGVLTLTGTTTVANYQTALRTITFDSTSDNPTAAARTISLVVTDGTDSSNTPTITQSVTPVNDAPLVAGFDATPSYTEGGSATVLDNNLTLSDADSSNLTGATISISANFVSGDRLNFTDQNGITGSYNSGTGVLTLSGTTTVANYQTALRTITFDSTSDNPTNAARTISLVVTDGTDTSNTPTVTQSVTPVNDAPVVAAFDATPSYTEGGSATVLDNNLTLSDADSTNLTGATISISANFVSGDRLNFTDQLGITGSYNTSTGVLTLSGTTTVANYQTALRTITFDSTSDNPTAAARTISLVVTDGTDTSNTPTITQSVTPVNDVPINTVPGAQTVTAGQNLIITGISTTDADHSSAATYVLSVDIGTLTLSTTVGGGVNAGQVSGNGTASVTITGATLSAINATLADAAGLTYTHSAAGAATLTITATDASAGSDADTVAITINAAPSSGGGGAVGSPAPSNPGDVVTTPDASGNLTGGDGDDTISLTDENDTNGYNVLAGAGNDMVQLSGRGDNTVAGGQGSDTIIGGAGSDNLNGNRGNDNIFGSNSADILHGGKEDDFINGNGGNDVISGDLGHDGLRGGQGDDTITGGAGNDILWGDRGNDSLTGGADIDLFAFTGNTGNDTITDFNAAEGDRLQLNGQTYTATTTNGNTILTLADGSTITLTGLISFDAGWISG